MNRRLLTNQFKKNDLQLYPIDLDRMHSIVELPQLLLDMAAIRIGSHYCIPLW